MEHCFSKCGLRHSGGAVDSQDCVYVLVCMLYKVEKECKTSVHCK